MNLRHMEVFRAVMLTGGVSGAAELLHVSQPAVSKLLAHAARQAGLTLFERVKGRLVPTPEAQALYAEVEALWRGVERVRDVSQALARPEAGTLRLGISASMAPWLAPRAVALLYERFPRLKVRMEILVAPIMVDALLDHSIDLGLGLLPNPHPNLVAARSYRTALACVMREDHVLAQKATVRPADLKGHRVIGASPSTPYGQALRRAYGKTAEALNLDELEVRSSTAACWFAQAGAGVAVVDRSAVAGHSFAGLAVRPFASAERLEVAVLRNRHRPLSVVQRAFCEVFDRVWAEALGRG